LTFADDGKGQSNIYPAGTPPHDFLADCATRFDTVEVDSTYCHTPSPSVVTAARRVIHVRSSRMTKQLALRRLKNFAFLLDVHTMSGASRSPLAVQNHFPGRDDSYASTVLNELHNLFTGTRHLSPS
jgi:Protein of unknown function DUF72